MRLITSMVILPIIDGVIYGMFHTQKIRKTYAYQKTTTAELLAFIGIKIERNGTHE